MFHLYYVLWSIIRSDRDQLWLKVLIEVNNSFSIMSRKSGKSCVDVMLERKKIETCSHIW